MHLSIVIVNWNTRQLLDDCLESIYRTLPRFLFSVIVIDNASSDGSTEMVRDRFPEVHLLENQENVGFAKACNQGIRLAGDAEYILLLNPDTVVLSDALQVLVDFMDDHPQVGAAGLRVIGPDGSLEQSCYVTPTLWREFVRLFHLGRIFPNSAYRMDGWDTDTPCRVDIIQGDCLLLRKATLDEVGLLDERFFIYSEDFDLCYRLQLANWLLYWVPQAQVVHYGGQSTGQASAEMFLKLYQSKLLYFRKHHGHAAALVYKVLLYVTALSRFLLIPWAMLEKDPSRTHRKNIVNNYRRLLGALPAM